MAKNEKTENIFAKLKELFNLTKENFADATLTDGSTLRSEGDMIEGAKVSLVGADGTVTAVPDGDLVLADGTKVTIKSGVVATLVAPAAAPDATATPAPTDAPAPAADATPAPTTMTDASSMPSDATPAPAPTDAAAPATDATPTDDSDVDLSMIADVVNQLASRVAALENALSDSVNANMEMSKKIEEFGSQSPVVPIKRKDVTEEVFGKQSKDDYFTKMEDLASYRRGITK